MLTREAPGRFAVPGQVNNRKPFTHDPLPRATGSGEALNVRARMTPAALTANRGNGDPKGPSCVLFSGTGSGIADNAGDRKGISPRCRGRWPTATRPGGQPGYYRDRLLC